MADGVKKSAGPAGEDILLVKAFQGGDRTAFDTLVNRHKGRVFNLCYWFLGDYQDADDASQETFIKIYRSLGKFRFESALRTWIFRIAVNTCKNKRISSAFRNRQRTFSFDNPGDGPGFNMQDRGASPSEALEKKERMHRIMEGINALPADQKEVITLRDIEGLSYEEIVQVTGISLGTVKSRLARARTQLKDKLGGMKPNGV